MRYYDITLAPQGSSTPIKEWTSHPNGNYNPSAQEVEFDILTAPFGTPVGAQAITIYGISLQELTNAQQFAGMNITISAGMKAGLPLANPKQSGVILVGTVWQSFGNWEGTEMTLDFVVVPSAYSLDNPGNIVLNWQANTPLSQALTQTLNTAYPDMTVTMNISDQLVLPNQEVHACSTLTQLAQYLQGMTKGYFLGENYGGVRITIQGGTIVVWDDTYQPDTVQINFTDLVGQPTWIEPNIMQAKFVMRADLQLGSIITMPQGMQNSPGLFKTTAQSLPSSMKNQSSFQGSFRVN
ncbi:MAG: hypothetical protein G3I10_09155, partial [Ferrovum sp.]|nr:hypothetical protein [Ferrovum sp.]